MTADEFSAVCDQFAADTFRLGITPLEYDQCWIDWGHVPQSIALRALREIVEKSPEAKRRVLRMNWRPMRDAVLRDYETWARAVGHR